MGLLLSRILQKTICTHTHRSSSEFFLLFRIYFILNPKLWISFENVASDPHFSLFNLGHFWFPSTGQLNVKQGSTYYRVTLSIGCLSTLVEHLRVCVCVPFLKILPRRSLTYIQWLALGYRIMFMFIVFSLICFSKTHLLLFN